MARIIETAKGSYKLLKGGNGTTLAVSVIDNKDVYEFDKPITELSGDEVLARIESTMLDDEFDSEFLNDDFSWIEDFEQY